MLVSSNNTTTLSLGGATTTLVDDPANGWHAEADNGDEITYRHRRLQRHHQRHHDGGYWVVTEPDGTSYYFGLNQLPGYASGDTTTNSAWTVPVYATASGAAVLQRDVLQLACSQAWRWNLDYVTDSHGDAMAYFYNTETNYYAADNGTTGDRRPTSRAVRCARSSTGCAPGSVYGAHPGRAEVQLHHRHRPHRRPDRQQR